ncbi:TcaA 3rd/4th domain-containing protein [Lactobacillus sp. PSON]|uniref:TcaA 3rd/4th domain-containing protein n=1 Tax=Lactobacillus sp. PSON TaxID=3455454 RepID=UPI004042DAD4
MNKKETIIKNHKKKWSSKHKWLIAITLLCLIIFACFYGWGQYYYQKNKQIDRIITSIQNTNSDLSKFVQPADPDLKVTEDSLKPLQNYYRKNPQKLTELSNDLHNGQYDDQMQLIQNGEYFMIFPKYQLRIKVYQPQVETNNPDSYLTVNGNNRGTMNGAGQNYYQNLGLIFPGEYHLVVNTKVGGRNLKSDSIVDIWSNKTIDLLIRTATFRIHSVPDGVVYINNKKVAILDKSGEYLFKNYPLSKNMTLYVQTKYKDKTIKSEPVDNLAQVINQRLSNTAEGSTDYNHHIHYLGNKKTAIYQDTDGNYIVNPLWPGLIQAKEASDILAHNFLKVNPDSFIKGEKNKSYKKLKKEVKEALKEYKSKKLSAQVTVQSIIPTGINHSQVRFDAIYKYKHKKMVIMEDYANFENKNGQQLIKDIEIK